MFLSPPERELADADGGQLQRRLLGRPHFPASYRKNFVEASRQIAEHIRAKGWNDTLFQCFFNGKHNFKARGWSHGPSPWLLDEPSNFQDFWAVQLFRGRLPRRRQRGAAVRQSCSFAATSPVPNGNAIRSTAYWITT